MKKEYDLNFHKALDIVLNGGAVKGEGFIDGIFMKLNSFGQLVIVDATHFYSEDSFVSIKSLSNQKFRELTILTLKELSY